MEFFGLKNIFFTQSVFLGNLRNNKKIICNLDGALVDVEQQWRVVNEKHELLNKGIEICLNSNMEIFVDGKLQILDIDTNVYGVCVNGNDIYLVIQNFPNSLLCRLDLITLASEKIQDFNDCYNMYPCFVEDELYIYNFDWSNETLIGIFIKPYVVLEKLYKNKPEHPYVKLKLFRNIESPVKNFVSELHREYLLSKKDPYCLKIAQSMNELPNEDKTFTINFSDCSSKYSRMELLRYRSTYINESMEEGNEIFIPVMTKLQFENLSKESFNENKIYHLTFLDSDYLREHLLATIKYVRETSLKRGKPFL